MNPVIVAADMITAYGTGIDSTWEALLAGKSALAPTGRFHCPEGLTGPPAVFGAVPGVTSETPAAVQLIEPLLRKLRPAVPPGTRLLLATTVGEIETLENAVLLELRGENSGAGAENYPGEASKFDRAAASDLSHLLEKACGWSGAAEGLVVSAACASSTVALAYASMLIRSGECDSVLVAACDGLSEFVFAGFATMNAVDPSGARPFDKERRGLSLGEAAAVALVMSGERAAAEGRSVLGEIAGWSLTNDASHITRPTADAAQLARAVRTAIAHSGFAPGDLAFISAHGTGTRYNDAMEIAAFSGELSALPVFSIKGGIGHTLGAAGLVETLVSLRALSAQVVPPTVGLCEPDDTTLRVSSAPVSFSGPRAALKTNSGFGGINAALVLASPEMGRHPEPSAPKLERDIAIRGLGWITDSAYGRLRQGESRSYAGRTTARLVGSVDALFQRKIENFGRFDPISRMTCYACALALQDAGFSTIENDDTGIVSVAFTGSLEANRAYFADYAGAGRVLARGNLFVYTLPSSPISEAAIHFGFHGPLFAMITPRDPLGRGLDAARSMLCETGVPPVPHSVPGTVHAPSQPGRLGHAAMLVVHAEPDRALASVVTLASEPCAPCSLSAHFRQLSASGLHLAELIVALAHPETSPPWT